MIKKKIDMYKIEIFGGIVGGIFGTYYSLRYQQYKIIRNEIRNNENYRNYIFHQKYEYTPLIRFNPWPHYNDFKKCKYPFTFYENKI